MHESFDQYLAEQIARENLFVVVVDPKFANAVLTDRIDAPFLVALEEFFPLSENGEVKSNKAEEESSSKDSIESGLQIRRPTNRALSRPKGTLFLVGVGSRQVLWSTFLREFQPSPNKLHEQASDVVETLKEKLQPGI